MRYLNISNMSTSGEYQFTKACSKCPALQQLVMSMNPGINEVNLQAILKACKDITLININMCNGIDNKTLDEIRSVNPSVNIIRYDRVACDMRDDGLRVWLPHKDAKAPGDKKKKKK